MDSIGTLDREDIVGHKIRAIYTSPWSIEPDGYGACTTYVELNNGVAFALQMQDFTGSPQILRVDLRDHKIFPCSENYLTQCIGETVAEVLDSEYWPGIGLFLSKNLLLYQRDFANPQCAGALLIGPYADELGQTYGPEDIVPYWQKPSV